MPPGDLSRPREVPAPRKGVESCWTFALRGSFSKSVDWRHSSQCLKGGKVEFLANRLTGWVEFEVFLEVSMTEVAL